MKLQILVPRYRETEEVLKPLLDSIALQQNVDLENEVGVVIVSDGGDAPLDRAFLDSYPFSVIYRVRPHGGVSAARNACLDLATAEYVMFCDADDMFVNACGLYIIFREMENGGFDSLVSVFIEETRIPATGEPVYINRENDSTFVHGKVHRRRFLIDKNIRWREDLTVHEDSYFNIRCQCLGENVKYCATPFYLWRWRDDSVCRHDPKYILKTYRNLIDSNDALVDDFLDRGLADKAAFYTAFMILDAYYTMNKPQWINQENKKYRQDTERRFAAYYKKHGALWEGLAAKDRMRISANVRTRSVEEGMEMETETIDGWLRRIRRLGRR